MTLQKNILLILIGLLLGSMTFIGAIGFFTTRNSIRDLRGQIMERTEDHVVQELEDYFGGAAPALEFMRSSVFEEPESAMENWRETGILLANYLRTSPDLTFLYYADAQSGNLLGVQRSPEGELIVDYIHRRNQRIPVLLELLDDGSLRPYEGPVVNNDPYDARERPWFTAALESEGLIWTDPYQFVTEDVYGITAAIAERDSDGNPRGVFGADLGVTQIAAFLDSRRVGVSGIAFIVLPNGEFLIDSKFRTGETVDFLREALRSQDLETAAQAGATTLQFAYQDSRYLALLKPIELPGGSQFVAVVMVPTSEFMGVVKRNAWATMIAALVVASLALGFSAFLAHRVTRPLSQISVELEQIGELRFRSAGDPPVSMKSSIREIARFNDSVGRMKVSLRSFSRYVPRDVVRTLLAEKDEASLGGEMREITIQFSDLAGFTGLCESLPVDEVFRELQIFLETLGKHQESCGGITSNFTGDGSMAIFNSPEPIKHHAAKACEAALSAIAELGEINRQRQKSGRTKLHARIGINTAEVLIGNLGTRDRFTYTAVGDGVNVASRMEGLNKLYGTQILVGEHCRESAGEGFEWRKVDRIAVAGRRQGVTVYEPLGLAGAVAGDRLRARDDYERALAAYVRAEFDLALELFGELRRSRPADSAAAVLYDRISDLIETKVSADWDGTYVARFK